MVEIDDAGKPCQPWQDIYLSRLEFSEYDEERFEDRLKGIIKIVTTLKSRAMDDYEAMMQYINHHPVSYQNWKGLTQWKGSESLGLALIDMEANLHETLGYRELYQKRPEYFNEFPFEDFRAKCRQELKTDKYLHTLKVKGKQHKSS